MKMSHSKTHQGLQVHSLGDDYPLSVVGVGDNWQVWNLINGHVLSAPVSSSKLAHDTMSYLSSNNMLTSDSVSCEVHYDKN